MRIIISPAKKMKINNDILGHRQMPDFLDETKILLEYLQKLSYEELKTIWKCSDNLARKNFDIIKNMDIENNLSPAILSFQGLQYQYMGSEVFSNKELDYLEEHLRILSGFYGILRAFDGIVPYRLEMAAKLLNWKYESPYEFWGDKIAKNIFAESQWIVNLASKEYSDLISKFLDKNIKMIDCIFAEMIDGRPIQKASLVKMARGQMLRYMAENNIKKPEDIKKFDSLSYIYREDLSSENKYVFIKKSKD